MPVIAAFGTKVERMRGERVNSWTAPERNWLRVSVSDPSWLFGKTWMSTLPPVSALIRFAASASWMCKGWVVGWLWASLYVNSADWARAPRLANAARGPPSRLRRDILIMAIPSRQVWLRGEAAAARSSVPAASLSTPKEGDADPLAGRNQ